MSANEDLASLGINATAILELVAEKVALLALAASGGGRTGDVKMALRATADTGWLLLNGDTIGNAASGADHAGDDYEDLFVALWTDLADGQAPVSGGRGASAAADWAANKTLTLGDYTNRLPVGAGDDYALGETGGSADAIVVSHTHTAGTLAADSNGAHTHSIQRGPSATGALASFVSGTDAEAFGNTDSQGAHTHTVSGSTASAGSSGTGANMPPFFAVRWQVKL